MKKLIAIAAAGIGFGFALPAAAQDAPINGVLTVFGDDPCPDNTICVRAPEADRYRIPSNLRGQGEIAPQNQSWAVRQESALTAGATGTGSCSTVGPGGSTGCFVQNANRANAEARDRAERNTNLPLP